ncbi:MAG TPA: hypothetical protein VMT17_08155 [Anaeromyxobacteraceae bacterium]|nr:hypothetical protein [Anaeromyxobacteraceae bacterium]
MWFVVLAFGALLVHWARLPAWLAPYVLAPPPAETRYALYFLFAALLRLVIRNARVSALERKGRREARKAARAAEERPALMDVGAGLGRGVAEVLVGADILGAAFATLAAVIRLALRSSRLSAAELAARARERRRRVAREHARAASCIAAVGALCAALAWAPLWEGRIPPRLAERLGQVAEALPPLRAVHPGR